MSRVAFIKVTRSTQEGNTCYVRADEVTCVIQTMEKSLPVLAIQLRNNVVINIRDDTWETLKTKLQSALGLGVVVIGDDTSASS